MFQKHFHTLPYTQKERKIKLKPRIKLNLNICLTGSAKSYLLVLHSYGSDKPENHAKAENRKGKEKERIEEKEKKVTMVVRLAFIAVTLETD